MNGETEKVLETIYDEVSKEVPAKKARDCPAMRVIADAIITLKDTRNHDLAIELGILNNKERYGDCAGCRK